MRKTELNRGLPTANFSNSSFFMSSNMTSVTASVTWVQMSMILL